METKKRIIKVEELGETFTFYFTESASANLTSHSIKPFIEFYMKAIPEHEKGNFIKEYPFMSKQSFVEYCEKYPVDISKQLEEYNNNKLTYDFSSRILVYPGIGYLFLDTYQILRLIPETNEMIDAHTLLWRIEHILLPFHIAKTIFTDERKQKLASFINSGFAMNFPYIPSHDANKLFYLHFNKRKEYEGDFKSAAQNALHELKIKWERKGLNAVLDVEDLDKNYYSKSENRDKDEWRAIYNKAKEKGLEKDLLDLAFEMRFINAFRNAGFFGA
jgi:hypothetical protein|nr:MAG TPA: hypothetical protein [Caudoviricetes sp.]